MLHQKAITVWFFFPLGPNELFGSPNIDKSQKSYLWSNIDQDHRHSCAYWCALSHILGDLCGMLQRP
jgi:hypothetical protein